MTTYNASLNIMNVTHAGSIWARGSKTLKEALDGDKEKGCQEKKEKVVLSGAKSPRFYQGKIVVTGVRREHPFLFV
ncbi:MAG TPA: hypothetical protein VI488_21105 [Candidatus Angelobacter sp.]